MLCKVQCINALLLHCSARFNDAFKLVCKFNDAFKLVCKFKDAFKKL